MSFPSPRSLSLTSRLTLWFAFSSIGLVSVSVLYLYWSLVKGLDFRDDQLIDGKIEAIRSILAESPRSVAELRHRIENEWPKRVSERVYVRIIGNDGKSVAETPDVPVEFRNASKVLEREFGARLPANDSRVVGFDGQVFRAVRAIVRSPWDANDSYVVQIALDRSQESHVLREYRERLLAVVLLAVLACIFIAYEIAKRGLDPLRKMQLTAAGISSSNLDARIPIAEMPRDLGALAQTFNGMLDRLEDAFERLRRFSADMAHELRTPVNNLAGGIGVALAKDRPVETYREVLGSALEECDRISAIIDSLLFLARSESPKSQIAKERVDLREQLASLIEYYEPLAHERQIRLGIEVPEPVEIEVERTLFQRAIGNLVSNSIRHTPPGGTIRVVGGRRGGATVIEVTDTGEGIAAEHLPHVFDRLYRVDQSRTKRSGGTGLGLAIVESIVRIHGGNVRIASAPGHGTTVVLELPAHS